MIAQDKKKEADNKIAQLEYLASFWNAEAVRKIRESRDNSGEHAFKNDEDFEQSMVTGEYKNNALLDAVVKMRELENTKKERYNLNQPRTKMPTDLNSIYNTLNKFNR